MSGKPYPEGVDEVVALLDRQAALEEEIADLAPKAMRHRAACEELSLVSGEVRSLLDRMDIQDQGNTGFGGRMGWFLAQMRKRLRESMRGGGK